MEKKNKLGMKRECGTAGLKEALELSSIPRKKMQITEIFESKGLLKGINEGLNTITAVPSDYYVVHIDKNNEHRGFGGENKKRWIISGSLEALIEKGGAEGMEPSTRTLFQSINCLGKKTNMIWFGGINEPRGLFHVNGFVEVTMQKCVVNI